MKSRRILYTIGILITLALLFMPSIDSSVSAVTWPTHNCYPDEVIVWCPTPTNTATPDPYQTTEQPYPGVELDVHKAKPVATETPIPPITIDKPRRPSIIPTLGSKFPRIR